MPTTEILLVKPIENLGSEGDIVKVRPGYARNFLFPRKKALPLNQANKKRIDKIKKLERSVKGIEGRKIKEAKKANKIKK
jgi:large subunit ribosomal protein L9